MGGPVSSPVLKLADGDNVVMARRTLEAGESFDIDGTMVTMAEAVPLGFKLAAGDLPEGTVVIRAGVPIGRMTRGASTGDLVHLHNLESLYLRTHARGED